MGPGAAAAAATAAASRLWQKPGCIRPALNPARVAPECGLAKLLIFPR